jgi:hypothetical protein
VGLFSACFQMQQGPTRETEGPHRRSTRPKIPTAPERRLEIAECGGLAPSSQRRVVLAPGGRAERVRLRPPAAWRIGMGAVVVLGDGVDDRPGGLDGVLVASLRRGPRTGGRCRRRPLRQSQVQWGPMCQVAVLEGCVCRRLRSFGAAGAS